MSEKTAEIFTIAYMVANAIFVVWAVVWCISVMKDT
jgi:hypothetical protein